MSQTVYGTINHFDVIGPKNTEFGKVTQNNSHYAVQGHSGHQFDASSYM